MRQTRSLQSDLADIKLTAKLTANRLDSLQKEYDEHLARCDGELVRISSENVKVQVRNDDLEQHVAVLEAKLKDKDNALEKLEKMQEALEAKIPTKDTLKAYANEKVEELQKELKQLKEDNRILKVDVRLGKLQLHTVN